MQTRTYVIVVVGAVLLAVVFVFFYERDPRPQDAVPQYVPGSDESEPTATQSSAASDAPHTEVVAENLDVPWEVLFLPDGELLVTQRPGTLLFLKAGVEVPISEVRAVGEGGLLGAALHPNFSENGYLYLYETREQGGGLLNQVNRYVIEGTTINFDETILADIPGARYHDGGRVAFAPDGYLYITVGDAGDADAAQDAATWHGTILRVTDTGEPAPGNPFNTAVYSYGHRNPQGLAWDAAGQLWSTEHGRSGVRSGYDELNRIVAGENYGWPESQGDEVTGGTVGPARHSGPRTTWAPASLAYLGGSLYFAGLRGETLYEAVLSGSEIVEWHEHFVGEFGRLRTVTVGPDGLLYLTTSNRDGRGNPTATDDRIIRINPDKLTR